MTIEEAIQNRERCLAYLKKCPSLTVDSESVEAVRMSLAALRAQQKPAKLDRSRWEGCGYCVDVDPQWCPWNFCPDCGRPLTEAAWAELERRIYKCLN